MITRRLGETENLSTGNSNDVTGRTALCAVGSPDAGRGRRATNILERTPTALRSSESPC
jgi:hypothetical protein